MEPCCVPADDEALRPPSVAARTLLEASGLIILEATATGKRANTSALADTTNRTATFASCWRLCWPATLPRSITRARMGKAASSLGMIALGVLAFAFVELSAPPRDLQPAAAGHSRPLPYALAGHTGPQQLFPPPPPAEGSRPLLIPPTAPTSAVPTARGPQQATPGPPIKKRQHWATALGDVRVDQTTWLVGNGSRGSVRDVLADMSCEHDELYNNKGCQIRCTQQQDEVLPAGGAWSEAELAQLVRLGLG